MSDYPMLISNKLHSFRNFTQQKYIFFCDYDYATLYNYRNLTVKSCKNPLRFRVIVVILQLIRVVR